GQKADVADIAIRMMRTGEGPRESESGTTSAISHQPSDIIDTDRPADVLPDEWREHKAIMQAIQTWKLEHVGEENAPFLDPIELRDPRIREWREKMRQAYNFNHKRNDNEHKAER
ncbi:MAG: hypothetical protein J6J71_05680, partial [Prevotella sp.]|nr:hypothetical protein [Prevotella sp.]